MIPDKHTKFFQMMKIHFLLPGDYSKIEALLSSNLASIRMRAGLVSMYAQSLGIQVTAGTNINLQAEIAVVGKIGADCGAGRAALWLNQLKDFKAENKKIILDYTDHHLANLDTPMGDFYDSVLYLINAAVVPSEKMRSLLSPLLSNLIGVIPDPLEIPIRPPSLRPIQDKPTLLWFGHGTNIGYLLDYLENQNLCDCPFNLIVLSNGSGLQALTARRLSTKHMIEVKTAIWSHATMQLAAEHSHMCIIPSDASDLRKAGASSNRLITALALGLPTLAEGLDSYNEFNNYFSNIRQISISEFVKNMNHEIDKVNQSQKDILPRFLPEKLVGDWKRFLQKSKFNTT